MSEEVKSKLDGKNLNEVAGGFRLEPACEGANCGKVIPTKEGEKIKFAVPDSSRPVPVPGQPNTFTYPYLYEAILTAVQNGNGELQWQYDSNGELVSELHYDEVCNWTVTPV
jgi:YD repeat-containing protein